MGSTNASVAENFYAQLASVRETCDQAREVTRPGLRAVSADAAPQANVALVLEPDAAVATAITSMLESLGLDVRVAASVPDAARIVARERVRLAIVDRAPDGGTRVLAAALAADAAQACVFTSHPITSADVHGLPVIDKKNFRDLRAWVASAMAER